MDIHSPKKPDSIFKSSIFIVMISIFGYALRLSFNMLLSHHLGKALYGDFTLGLRLLMTASMIFIFGSNAATNRFYSYYSSSQDSKKAHHFISWNMRLILRITVIFLLLMSVLSISAAILHFYNIKKIQTYHLSAYLIWLTPLSALLILLSSYLQSNKNIYWSNLISSCGQYFVGLLIFIPAILFLDYAFDRDKLVITMGLIFVVLLAFETIIVFNKMGKPFFEGAKHVLHRKQQQDDARHWFSVSRYLMLNQSIYYIIVTMDIVILELFGRTEEMVGEFAAILSFWFVFELLMSAIGRIYKSHISSSIKTEEGRRSLQQLITKAQLINFFLSFSALIIVSFEAKSLLNLFGPDYKIVYIPLIMMFCVGFFQSMVCPTTSILANSGHEKFMLVLSIIRLALMLFFGIILTHYYGVLGLVCAIGIVTIIENGVFVYYVRKLFGLKVAIIF